MDADLMERLAQNDRDWRRYMMVKLDELHRDQKDHAQKMEDFKDDVQKEQNAMKIGLTKVQMKAGFLAAAISTAFGSVITLIIAVATNFLKKI